MTSTDGNTDFDPNLQIRNLDTGEVVSISDFDTAQITRIRSRSLETKLSLPQDLQMTTFQKEIKVPLFNKPTITDFLPVHKGNVWCVVSSPDGQYAASGGEDGMVVLYSISGPLNIIRKFQGHTSDVVMLEFSSDNFLLSCSLDSTVRLWHPSQEKELGVFQHEEAVTAVAFLPTDSSIFIASTLGNTVFLWNIRNNEVLHRISFVSPPTAATISPDGKFVAIGCLNGFCFVYAMPDFRYVTQFIAGPRGKKQSKNEKVSSITFVGNDLFFVATNDSRIRLYALENFSVVRKYLGHESREAQLRLSVSSDKQLLMSPSENDGDVFIWPIDHTQYFKGASLFSTFLKDRSKTAIGLRFGRKHSVNAATFTKDASISRLSIVLGDCRGSVFRVQSQ